MEERSQESVSLSRHPSLKSIISYGKKLDPRLSKGITFHPGPRLIHQPHTCRGKFETGPLKMPKCGGGDIDGSGLPNASAAAIATATAASGTKQAEPGPNPSYPESNFQSFETCPPDEVKPERISHQAAVTLNPTTEREGNFLAGMKC
ncbi:hypothetical protein GWI33_013272 [Rhynchophorus ferrugineus]|uniref:Uncharacterized protein n=1 Tax=Rhynchophorus ferrugineus TaxID=354439 RepID=A0A834I7F8_RHYFE|nr:hypothetical protein GWI33_013272 [Rhynchophorus ferrugineus]